MGLNLNINAVGRKSYSWDNDAIVYLDNSGITDQYIRRGINNFTISLKNNNLWTKCKAIYPFAWDNEQGNKLNLVDPRDLDAAFRLTFDNAGGTVLFSKDGIKFNGGHADTHLIPSSILTINDTHLSYYFIDNDDLDGLSGCRTGSDLFGIQPFVTSQFVKSFMYAANADGLLTSSSIGDKIGYSIATRTATDDHRIFFNGNQVALHNLTSGNLPTNSVWLGKFNYTGGVLPDEKQSQIVTIGDGLSVSESEKLNQLVQKLQDDLSRRYYNVNLVGDGDSIMLGNNVGVGEDIITGVAALFPSNYKVDFTNKGVSGQTVQQMEVDASSDIDPLIDSLADRNILLAGGGVNDLGLDLGLTDEQCYQRIKTYCTNRQSAGWETYRTELLPQSTPSYASRTTYEDDRTYIRNKVRTELISLITGNCEWGTDATMGVSGSEDNTTYYLSDKIHPTAVGNDILENLCINEIL